MPRELVENLLNQGIELAQNQLAKRGEFSPFALWAKKDSEQAEIAMADGENATEMLALLEKAAKDLAASGTLEIGAIIYDSRVVPPEARNKVDAICLRIDEVSGEKMRLFLPYTKKLFRGVKYGELFGQEDDGFTA